MVQYKSDLLIDTYLDWYKKKITVKELENAEQIITPYVNHINDRISIFIEFLDNDNIRLSDDGITFDELDLMSLNIDTETRKKLIADTLLKYSLTLDNGIISTVAENINEFPQKKHNLIQAILSIYDLLMTNRTNVKGIFKAEALTFFFENDFGGNAGVKFTGESGIDYLIDYSLGATTKRPNTIIKLQNNVEFANVTEQVFIAQDLKNEPTLKNKGLRYVMVIGNQKIPDRVAQAASYSDIEIIRFEEKAELLALK